MPAKSVNKYDIKFRREGDTDSSWFKIGHATEILTEHGPMVLCRIMATPINWDGTFALFEARPWKPGAAKGEETKP